jgi:hypothetical protein
MYFPELTSFQNVPTLKQAQMYELSALHSPEHPAATSTVVDSREKSKNVALRLFSLAAQCRVRLIRSLKIHPHADFRHRHKGCQVVLSGVSLFSH